MIKVENSRKGKTYEEIFGIKKALKMKQKQSVSHKGKKVGPHSDETKQKMRDKKLGKKQSEETIRKRVEKLIGQKRSEEVKEKMRIFTKEQEIEICNEYFSEEKPSSIVLGKKWGCGHVAIIYVIKRNGYNLRTKSESATGKKHSEETKNIKREQAILYHQTHSGPFKDTKPELKMKGIFNDLNIPFEHQFRLGNHLYDFYIPNTNILIEVDGDYWHSNPKKFSKLNKYQLKQKEKDLKNEQLAKDNSFILLRFWEDDILNNTEEVKNKLKVIIQK